MTTPADQPFDLHIPAGTAALFQQRVAEVPEDKRRSWRFHKVASGETLDDIARTYHVRASEIAFVNQLPENSDLANTDSLVVPVASTSPGSSANASQYRAQRGDTLVKVADRFGVTVEQLRRWNHLKGAAIAPGRRLFVAEPAHITSASRGRRKGRSAAAKPRPRATASSHAPAPRPSKK